MKILKELLAFLLFGLIILLLVLLARQTFAAGTLATVSFFPVTEYTDNTPMPASDVLKYTVKWSGGAVDITVPVMCPAGSPEAGKICVPVPVPCGDRVFTATVTPKPTAKYPVESSPSNSVQYASGVTCSPKPVTGVTVS